MQKESRISMLERKQLAVTLYLRIVSNNIDTQNMLLIWKKNDKEKSKTTSGKQKT